MIGPALPGPSLGQNGVFDRYVYPFGRRLSQLFSRVVPNDWIISKESSDARPNWQL